MVGRPMKRMTITPEVREQILASVDWKRLDAMTDAEMEAAQRSDPDAAPPLTDEEIAAAKAAWFRSVREKTGLTQAAFAKTYGIPLGTLREWEQGTSTPDRTARAYLRVIAADPVAVARLAAA